MAEQSYWSSDVRVSMPLPPKQPRRVPMFGFSFTDGGLAHDIDDETYARLSTPSFMPRAGLSETVYEDVDLDAPPTDVETF